MQITQHDSKPHRNATSWHLIHRSLSPICHAIVISSQDRPQVTIKHLKKVWSITMNLCPEVCMICLPVNTETDPWRVIYISLEKTSFLWQKIT